MSPSHRTNILHLLAGSSSITAFEAAKNLLAHGSNPSSIEDDGLTPLHVACAWDSLAICQLLMHYGADPLAEDDFGRTPLDMATGKTQEFLQRLLAKDSQERRGILRRIFVCHSSGDESTNNLFMKSFRAVKLKMRKSLDIILRRSINEENQPINVDHIMKPTNLINSQCCIPATGSSTPSSQNCTELNLPINKLKSSTVSSILTTKDSSCSSQFTCQISSPQYDYCDQSCMAEGSEILKNCSIITRKSEIGSHEISSITCHNTQDLDVSESYETAEESFTVEELDRNNQQLSIGDGYTLEVEDEREKIQRLLDYELRLELKNMGISAGPICSRTRHIYEKKLLTLRHNLDKARVVKFSRQLEMALKGIFSMEKGKEIDEKVRDEFKFSGVSSFCYIMLDSRLIPDDIHSLTFLMFVKAVFYIGKGKKNRPLAHLILAKKERNGKSPKIETNAKLRRINSIWSSNKGIICLQIHHNISDDEAFVREAALIEAVGVNNLTNVKNGEWHGSSKSWELSTKAEYGVYLLKQAMDVLKLEGLREIYPHALPEQ